MPPAVSGVMRARKPLIGLFTYGGGMRGLIPAYIMSRIEDATGLRMAEMVDVFSGPSTGAILNAALTVPDPDHPGRPRFRARHLIRFYEREGRNIFPPDRFREFRGLIHDFNNRTMKMGRLETLMRRGHYDPAPLARSLRDLYGAARLGDALSGLVLPVYDIENKPIDLESGETGGHALWLRNTRFPGNRTPASDDVSLFDAVMASCAAPTYFPCHGFPLGGHARTGIDGSVFDNPCVSYFGALQPCLPADRPFIYVLLGTGYGRRSIRGEDWNRYGPIGVVDPVNDLPLIKILFHATESALMESFTAALGDNLFVFNRAFEGRDEDPQDQIDNASPENLKKLVAFGESILEENRGRFDALCNILVKNRDARAEKQAAVHHKVRRLFPAGLQRKDRGRL